MEVFLLRLPVLVHELKILKYRLCTVTLTMHLPKKINTTIPLVLILELMRRMFPKLQWILPSVLSQTTFSLGFFYFLNHENVICVWISWNLTFRYFVKPSSAEILFTYKLCDHNASIEHVTTLWVNQSWPNMILNRNRCHVRGHESSMKFFREFSCFILDDHWWNLNSHHPGQAHAFVHVFP